MSWLATGTGYTPMFTIFFVINRLNYGNTECPQGVSPARWRAAIKFVQKNYGEGPIAIDFLLASR